MVQRVLIQGGQAAAMTVSLPAIDVTVADCNQTCFDSRWSGLNPFMKGSVAVSNGGSAGVGYGQTLDVPPLFFGYGQIINPSNGQPTNEFGTTCYMLRGNGIDEWFYASVGTSGISFAVNGWTNLTVRFTFALYKRTSG